MKLSSPVTALASLGPAFARRLERLEIFSLEDLLLHVPFRYLDLRNTKAIYSITPDELVSISGEITLIKNIYTKWGRKIQLAKVQDSTGSIEVVWFNQPYLTKTLTQGSKVFLAGKVGWFARKPALISPEYEVAKEGPSIHTGRLIPVYHETSGVSSKWLRSKIAVSFPLLKDEFKEFLPQKLLSLHNFLGFSASIRAVHFPKSLNEAEQGRRRLSFNELLFLQLGSLYRKEQWLKNEASYKLTVNQKEIDSFKTRYDKFDTSFIPKIFKKELNLNAGLTHLNNIMVDLTSQ